MVNMNWTFLNLLNFFCKTQKIILEELFYLSHVVGNSRETKSSNILKGHMHAAINVCSVMLMGEVELCEHIIYLTQNLEWIG